MAAAFCFRHWRRLLALTLLAMLVASCAGTRANVGLGTNEGPREKAQY